MTDEDLLNVARQLRKYIYPGDTLNPLWDHVQTIEITVAGNNFAIPREEVEQRAVARLEELRSRYGDNPTPTIFGSKPMEPTDG